MSNVNFIQNFRLFMEFSKRKRLTSYERIFYLALFARANELAMQDENHDWPDDFFPVSNSELKDLTGFDERQIRSTKNSLQQKGLLDFKKGNRKKSDPEYRIYYMGRSGYKIVPLHPSESELPIECENAPNESTGYTIGDKNAVNSIENRVIGCKSAPNIVPNDVPNTVPNDAVIGCENVPNNPIYNNIYKKQKKNININSNPYQIPSGNEDAEDGIEVMEENQPHQEQIYEELIKNNINYTDLLITRPNDKELIDEIVDLLLETVLSGRERIQVAGELRPAAFVKQRLLKLENGHIDYVLHCLHQNTANIQNVKQYLLAMLFNAPATMNSYWQAKVNHDMG